MDLPRETLTALDWPVVVTALAERARTSLGVAAVQALQPLPDAAAVRAAHDAVDEILALWEEGTDLPVGGVEDVGVDAARAAKGEVLDVPELRQLGATLDSLRRLQWACLARDEQAPRLFALGERIEVDDVLADDLAMAFDNQGRLSSAQYPELGQLRRRIDDLHGSIRSTLDELVRGDTLDEVLQDRFVTQRNDRYVVPIKAHAKRWDLGIVHGSSGSGATVYIEPKQVVELNNRLKIAEGELLQAERRILRQLSAAVGREAEAIAQSLEATAAIDLAVCRATLARDLSMSRPAVGIEGVVTLRNARHPVLALRGVAVVGNDLALSATRPALLLTGPNAGGKTVAMKTVGLCALLVRVGCFVPADPGSRVDHFPAVLAAIGDAQTVEGDLSSFSGHLVVLQSMLDAARPGALLLLDELASGTDPAQGAALAQAVLEALLDRGPRLVVTTHFGRLKALPAADPRFSGAAVEYVDGRPTYRVVANSMGESHALGTARRMGLDAAVLDRADLLLDAGERTLSVAVDALEEERQALARARRKLADREAALANREDALAAKEARVADKLAQAETQLAADFRDRLAKADKAIAAVVADLQRAPDHGRVAAARASVDALRGLAPAPTDDEPPPSADAPPVLRLGDRVRLRTLGQEGEVVGLGDGGVQVRAGALTVRVQPTDVELLKAKGRGGHSPPKPVARKRRGEAARAPKPGPARMTELGEALRLPGNTLDLRGQRVDEALDAIEAFLDKAALAGRDHVFVLHGHGTGAMKQAVRQHLPRSGYVEAWAPANADQGGDAYTVAALRS